MKTFSKVCLGLLFTILACGAWAAVKEGSLTDQREQARKLMQEGNAAEAWDKYEALALNPADNVSEVGNDLNNAVNCLQQLNRYDEVDEFREKVIAVHSNTWQLLQTAAQSYFNGQHNGYIIAGEFQRGYHRGGGRYVNSFARDRIRALQLMKQAMKLIPAETPEYEQSQFYFEYARMTLGYNSYNDSWRLQYLSDLAELPDYDEGYSYYSGAQGAPVLPDGTPVYYSVPESYDAAGNDGERWRWLLSHAMAVNANVSNQVLMTYAEFLQNQFGVQTMARYGWAMPKSMEEGDESGTYALHTLKDDETIARLATGIKRFTLPEDARFISIYKKVSADKNQGYGENAANTLAQIYENRRQYDAAAACWMDSIERFGPGHDNWKQKRYEQITKPWCRFDPLHTQPTGTNATVDFLFRNGKEVRFTAHALEVKQLLDDVKEYLEDNPKQIDWNKVNIGNIGYMLVENNFGKYVGKKTAEWKRALEPRSHHFDKRETIDLPLAKAGAYLLTAEMEDGNTSRIIIWIDDTVLVKKTLDGGTYFFAADALSGGPIPNMHTEFFGYKQEYIENKLQQALGRRYNVLTRHFAKFTDKDGQVMPGKAEFEEDSGYNWMIVASTEQGRYAYLGFSHIWIPAYYDQEYNQRKVFTITDRPVYRPNQPVEFKVWVRQAKYDQEDTSVYAGQSFTVAIYDPQNKKVYEQQVTADEYGGFSGVYTLPDEAPLGMYSVRFPEYDNIGSFRVEEYKKPEFEVKVNAPDKPVMLGEKITATVAANYYFGAPVTEAKVKYKVLRTPHDSRWYPIAPWDWMYGSGYWWFGYDYDWYPGWSHWGCKRPVWWWWPQPSAPPEVVAEGEAEIGSDGTYKIEIDTGLAKEVHGNQDHKYAITAEVTDQSRRTIVGNGSVLVAREPFKVYAWIDRGFYRVGDVIQAHFKAQTLDNRPVAGSGHLNLYSIRYTNAVPVETVVQEWQLDTNERGEADIQITASKPGQYRLSYTVKDEAGHAIEGGYVFCVRGSGFDGKQYRFNAIELVPDKKEYAPGDTVKLMINTERAGGTVVLFIRPCNGIYLPPKIIRLTGKSTVEEIVVVKKDMPNFFVEAFTISDGRYYSEMREITVPPEKRVLNVEVLPSAERYKPGEKAKVAVRLTDFFGEPFKGTMVMSIYDKSVEYISGGSNVPDIRDFFWKWRRHHNINQETSLDRVFFNLVKKGDESMNDLGVFGGAVADEISSVSNGEGYGGGVAYDSRSRESLGVARGAPSMKSKAAIIGMADSAVMAEASIAMDMEMPASPGAMKEEMEQVGGQPGMVEPSVRKEFADTAYWNAVLNTDDKGMAEIECDMPENLTAWKIKVWALGPGTKVGEGQTEVITSKDLLLRMQAPRFFVEKDEVVLSANIHNYLESAKSVRAVLELDGPCLDAMDGTARTVEVPAKGEKRVDWRVKVVKEGEAVIRMKALTDEESDAMEMKFPVLVHGMLKTESFCGVIRPAGSNAIISLDVPSQRRTEESRLEIRYSPTLAGAMVDALPYLVEYPYGCTEQTLNRFLPTVIAQKVLKEIGVDLKAIQEKQTNLNAQEIGDDKERAAQWKRWNRNPVFDEAEVTKMVKEGVDRLTSMQLSDGGWGWFSGYGEQSWAHTTAYVVHGLQIARKNDVAIDNSVIERGVQWLEDYQFGELRKLKNYPDKKNPYKPYADNLDAFVYMVLADAGKENPEMREFLYRDRTKLAVYSMAMFGMALHVQDHIEQRDMLVRNITQYLVIDNENQTAYLNLQNGGYWWCWYGSEYEAQAYYLKLLALTDPKSEVAAGLVKYLLNNRKHATYWNSTRDTALCIEAMADYLRASGEDKPDMTVEIYVDGRKYKEVRITPDNLFGFDNKLVIEGDGVTTGKHTVEIRRRGKGPVYFNAYLTYFTLEDYITKAGLEIKVERKYYKLNKVDKTIKVAGSRGQALDQKVEKYEREEIKDMSTLKSGDIIEIELEIESKNDYEYILLEDMKAAGCEPVEVRSGYNGNDIGAYVEYRDERVVLFVMRLARGKHSVSYKTRAEIPGIFSALPTKASAMYAPELKANSDEIKIKIVD